MAGVLLMGPPLQSFRSAVKWALVMNWGQKGFGALVVFFLAAVLGPTDFGLVSMAVVYIAFVEMFLEQGLTAALIQRPDLRDEHLDSAFWFVLAMASMLTAVSAGLSAWWSRLNGLPELAPVIIALSALIPVQGLTLVQQAVLQRRKDYKSLAIRANCSVIFGGAGGMTLAFAGFGAWALVGQKFAEAISSLVLLWSISRWRPRLRADATAMRELFGFSASVFGAKLGVFVGGRLDVLAMGLFFGPTAVGLYRLAERLVKMVLDLVTGALQVVSLPEFSQWQSDPQKLRSAVLLSLRLSCAVTLPAMAALAVSSDFLTRMFGQKWVAAAGCMKVLCVWGALQSISAFLGPLLQAVGKPKWLLGFVWLHALLMACLLVLTGITCDGLPHSAQTIWIASSRAWLALVVALPMSVWVLARVTDIRIADLVGVIRRPLTHAIGVLGLAAGVYLLLWGAGLSQITTAAVAAFVASSTAALGVSAHLRLGSSRRPKGVAPTQAAAV